MGAIFEVDKSVQNGLDVRCSVQYSLDVGRSRVNGLDV